MMTVPAANASRDSSFAAPVPFSYAQAAKRTSAAPKQEYPTQAAENGTERNSGGLNEPLRSTVGTSNGAWADDATDDVVVTEEQAQSGENIRDGGAAQHGDTAVDNRIDEAKMPPANTNDIDASYSTSPAKQESSALPSTTPSEDLSWRRRSDSRDTVRDVWNDTESRSDKSKGKPVQDQPAPLIEAPVPAINFWAQRAQEAKSRQSIPVPSHRMSTAGMDTQQARTTTTWTHDPRASNNGTSSIDVTAFSAIEENAPEVSAKHDRKASVSRGGRGRNFVAPASTVSSRKNSVRVPAAAVSSQFPSLQDSQSWPTPETVHDGDRKKPQGKSHEKSDNDRLNAPTAKAHGKNEWVHVPFTPTVKFETPIPTNARRGGRGGGRGGRGNHPGGTTGARGPTTVSEDAASPMSKGDLGSTAERASSLPRKSKAATSEGEQTVSKRASLPMGASAATNAIGEPAVSSNENFSSERQAEDERALRRSLLAHASVDNGEKPPFDHTRDSAAKSGEIKPRRRSSRVSEQDTNFSRHGGRKRSGSLNGSTRPTWTDRRLDNTTRSYEAGREPYSTLPYRERGEGRPDRGRPGRGRGSFYNSHTPSNIQTNNLAQYYSGPPHSAKSATFNGSYSGHSAYTRSSRGGGNGGARPASIPTDAPYGRFPSHYAISPFAQPFISPGSYNSGTVTPTGSVMPANPYMNLMLYNGVAGQLNYYFSFDNLCKDMYLRQHMDSQGFVSLKLVAQFTRMRNLTTDLELIKNVASTVPDFELHHLSPDDPLIRRREGWANFVLAMEERDPSAQHEGPQLPDKSAYPYTISSANANGYNHDVLSRTHPGQLVSQFSPVPTGSPVNGNIRPVDNRYSMSTVNPRANFMPVNQTGSFDGNSNRSHYEGGHDDDDDEPDSYPDHKIDSQLTILVRPQHDQIAPPQTSRSFSNGTIEDVSSVLCEDNQSRSPVQTNGVHSR